MVLFLICGFRTIIHEMSRYSFIMVHVCSNTYRKLPLYFDVLMILVIGRQTAIGILLIISCSIFMCVKAYADLLYFFKLIGCS